MWTKTLSKSNYDLSSLGLYTNWSDETIERRAMAEVNFSVTQRAPVPPSGPDPCTNIPGQGNAPCELTGMNVAGAAFSQPPSLPPPPPPPSFSSLSWWPSLRKFIYTCPEIIYLFVFSINYFERLLLDSWIDTKYVIFRMEFVLIYNMCAWEI